jgi:hypothetical protein
LWQRHAAVDVAVHRVRRQVEHRRIAARRQQHRVRRVGLDRPGHQVAAHDAARRAVDHHEVQHLAPREQLHPARVHLPHQRAVAAQQQLLPRLPARVERARHLRAAERAVRQRPAVLARERHALRGALVDDVRAQLGEAVDVPLARAEVAALHRVVEQPPHAVAVVLVVLRRVDAALRGHAVRAARRVLDAEIEHVVAQLAQRRGGRAAREAGAHHDHRVLALVRRADELDVRLVRGPLGLNRPIRDVRVQDRFFGCFNHHLLPPRSSRAATHLQRL